MRILVYGGCHAAVIKDFLDEYTEVERVDTEINFKLIETQKPFPYERLGRYDAIVFNPIFKTGYETTELEAHCRAAGVKMVKYPWIQWGGYWYYPGKLQLGAQRHWGQPELMKLFGNPQNFDEYYEALFDKKKFKPGLVEKGIETTTGHLRKNETDGKVDIPISDFILSNYRKTQLFLTPDHGTNAFYRFLIPQITDALGLRLDPAFYGVGVEAQEGVRLPIPPGMAERLGLSFQSTQWAHNQILGKDVHSLRKWAESSFPGMGLSLVISNTMTRIKSLAGDKMKAVQRRSKRLFTPSAESIQGYYTGLIADFAEPVRLYRKHWDRFSF